MPNALERHSFNWCEYVHYGVSHRSRRWCYFRVNRPILRKHFTYPMARRSEPPLRTLARTALRFWLHPSTSQARCPDRLRRHRRRIGWILRDDVDARRRRASPRKYWTGTRTVAFGVQGDLGRIIHLTTFRLSRLPMANAACMAQCRCGIRSHLSRTACRCGRGASSAVQCGLDHGNLDWFSFGGIFWSHALAPSILRLIAARKDVPINRPSPASAPPPRSARRVHRLTPIPVAIVPRDQATPRSSR
jgi:hypothetical protein